MRNTFSKEMILAVGFLAILVAPGIIRTALELRGGDSPQVLNLFHQKATAKNLRAYEREMEEVSWVAKHLRPAVQYVQFRLLREAGDKAIVGRDGWMFYKPGFRYLTERPDLANRAAPSSDPLPAIVAFRDELAKRQIQLLVMIAPNKESVYPERLTRRAVGFDVLVCPQTRRLLEELKRVEIEVVDLFETYRRAKHRPPQNPASPLYLVQDSHWSPAGVEVAAKAVAQKIMSRSWMQRGGVAYESRPMSVRRVGDVIRMLQVPQIQQRIAPEEILCQQIVRSDTQLPYQDDPEAEILVLGDSFLGIYQQDEPGSAGFVAHLARELQQTVTALISDGGASTLVRQELHRRPRLLAHKKLVIWEFVERDIRFGTEGWQTVPLPPASRAGRNEALPRAKPDVTKG